MDKSERELFNSIAPIYSMFFNHQVKYYKKILDRAKNVVDIFKYENIIDVGCGTGALCYVLNKKGLKVTGIDAAKKMINIAEKNLHNNKEIDLVQASVLERIPFDEKSFDIAISSYVLHGMKNNERQMMYAEMSRIARHMVIFHDYNDNRAFYINVVEWLEGGDYFNFIKNAKTEMAESFKKVQVVNVDSSAAWYICTPYD